jgi:gluconate 2-dehydrogenase alpha chain
VVVVGLGAAGGVAVQPLAEAGLDVVGLEAGTWLDRRDFAPDEIRNNYRDWPMLVQKAELERPTVRATSDTTANRAGSHPMMNAVGGTTLHYWAQSWRLSPWDFRVVSETVRRYGSSRIPAGSTVEDWPFTYEELEPYYDRVEREIGVSGQAGNVRGDIDPRGNRFEGPRQREYPMPPLRPKLRAGSAGTHSPGLPPSTAPAIRVAPAADTTASATRGAARSTPRTAPTSRRSRGRSRRATCASFREPTSRRSRWMAMGASPA